jgi:hypothetical protein
MKPPITGLETSIFVGGIKWGRIIWAAGQYSLPIISLSSIRISTLPSSQVKT